MHGWVPAIKGCPTLSTVILQLTQWSSHCRQLALHRDGGTDYSTTRYASCSVAHECRLNLMVQCCSWHTDRRNGGGGSLKCKCHHHFKVNCLCCAYVLCVCVLLESYSLYVVCEWGKVCTYIYMLSQVPYTIHMHKWVVGSDSISILTSCTNYLLYTSQLDLGLSR